MGGNKAAYATASLPHPRADRAGIHSIRRGQPTRLPQDGSDTDDSGPVVTKRDGFAVPEYEDENDADDDYDDDDDDFYEQQAAFEREREVLREREEMKKRFTFQEHRRRNLKTDIMSAMRRKRRMLLRNENLRFRELYKPPEPGVVVTVIALVTIVSLILTKSWPFY